MIALLGDTVAHLSFHNTDLIKADWILAAHPKSPCNCVPEGFRATNVRRKKSAGACLNRPPRLVWMGVLGAQV